jgi:hypothetical protein
MKNQNGGQNVKSNLLSGCLLLVFVAVTAVAPAQAPGGLITVLNPVVANKMAERLPLTSRLNTLEGKTLFLVDIGWGGPEAAPSVYEEMQAWFAKNMPTVKTEIRRIKGSYESDDPALWKEIATKGNAAFVGISG